MIPVVNEYGYHVEMLNTTRHSILEEGQKYVHNDACYPAILVIGQLIDALLMAVLVSASLSLIGVKYAVIIGVLS